MNQANTYIELFLGSIKQNSDQPCLLQKPKDTYETMTYGGFSQKIFQTSSMLFSAGFNKLDRAVIIGPNTMDWLIAYHGVMFAGGINVPLDPLLTPSGTEDILLETQPSFIFCSQEFFSLLNDLKTKLNCIKQIIILEPTTNSQPSANIENQMTLSDFYSKSDTKNDIREMT